MDKIGKEKKNNELVIGKAMIMKTKIWIVATFILSSVIRTQATTDNGNTFSSLNKSENNHNYTMWQLGYAGDEMCNGAYIGYTFGIKVWQGLFVNTGLRAGWKMASIPYVGDMHFVDIKVPVRVAYQINMTKDFSILPQTGMNLGAIAGVSWL